MKTHKNKGTPLPGKIYAITSAPGVPSILNGNTWAESVVDVPVINTTMPQKNCPACMNNKLNPEEAKNSLSRYVSTYICADCGLQEAFEGFFWRGLAIYAGFLDHEITESLISKL